MNCLDALHSKATQLGLLFSSVWIIAIVLTGLVKLVLWTGTRTLSHDEFHSLFHSFSVYLSLSLSIYLSHAESLSPSHSYSISFSLLFTANNQAHIETLMPCFPKRLWSDLLLTKWKNCQRSFFSFLIALFVFYSKDPSDLSRRCNWVPWLCSTWAENQLNVRQLWYHVSGF